jgi:hypothetical protein
MWSSIGQNYYSVTLSDHSEGWQLKVVGWTNALSACLKAAAFSQRAVGTGPEDQPARPRSRWDREDKAPVAEDCEPAVSHVGLLILLLA